MISVLIFSISISIFAVIILASYSLSLKRRLKFRIDDCDTWRKIYDSQETKIQELESNTPIGLIEKIEQAKKRELGASKKREEASNQEVMAIAKRQELEAKLQMLGQPEAFRSPARFPTRQTAEPTNLLIEGGKGG